MSLWPKRSSQPGNHNGLWRPWICGMGQVASTVPKEMKLREGKWLLEECLQGAQLTAEERENFFLSMKLIMGWLKFCPMRSWWGLLAGATVVAAYPISFVPESQRNAKKNARVSDHSTELSPCASPIVLMKKDGILQFCVDCRFVCTTCTDASTPSLYEMPMPYPGLKIVWLH